MSSFFLYLFLFVSLFINVFAFWYIRELLKEMRIYYERFSTINYLIRDYKNHLSAVYELDMFYGDSTLGGLLAHTKDLSKDIGEYIQDFPFEDIDQEEEEDFEEEN